MEEIAPKAIQSSLEQTVDDFFQKFYTQIQNIEHKILKKMDNSVHLNDFLNILDE